MRFTYARTLPAALTLALAAGLTVGTFGPSGGSEQRPPAETITVTDPTEAQAWEIFEHGGGAAKLRVDPSRPYRVEFMSATPEYPSWAGPMDAVVVGKDMRWYWFAASYTDTERS